MPSDVVDRKITHLLGLVDTNRDGFVDRSDYTSWIERMAGIRGLEVGTEAFDRMEALFLGSYDAIYAACANEAGRIPLDSFHGLLASMSAAGAEGLSGWSDGFFRLLDADADGVIGPQEYRDLMASVLIDAATADASFARLDLNGDGRISRDEFTQLYLEFFTSDDPEAPGSRFWGPFQ